MSKSKKSILLISYGPVPTPEYQTIEGGGMRVWGIAQGLHAHGFSITVAVNEGFPQGISTHNGINLTNWSLNDEFKQLINSFDAVVISYCMGDPSVFVADNISDHVSLILDAYVPIYIEVSARDSEDKKTEFINYSQDIKRFNHVLKRGDYFLCANDPQKHMYAGILGSLNILNPATYKDDRILVVPFGIEADTPSEDLAAHDNPYSGLGIHKDDFVLLWFGGLYPWFNFTPLIDAVIHLSENPRFKFVLVGGKNPYNSHPDFVRQYDLVSGAFKQSGLIGSSVHMIDWVDYSTRGEWYRHADAVISINQTGEENVYSWRTRVMDYVWGNLPMITNGGDPLSDHLLAENAAIKIDVGSSSMEPVIRSMMDSPRQLAEVRNNLSALRDTFRWDKVVYPIASHVTNRPLPYLDFKKKQLEWSITGQGSDSPISVSKTGKALDYYHRARRKGLKRSARFALSVTKSMATSRLKPASTTPKAVLLSHPIDETGAPLVLLDIARDFSRRFKPKDVYIVSPDIKKYILHDLIGKGFTIKKMAAGISGRIIQAQLNIQTHDFVLMNTVAVYDNYRTYVYWMLESNRLKEAYWFIHEDNPSLRFTDKGETERVKKLITAGRLKVYVPSQQTAKEYNQFFSSKTIKPVTLRVNVGQPLARKRQAKDFDKISFISSGSPWDGRKGQFLLLNALLYFEKYLRKVGKKYRPYSVHLLALGDDYISDQLTATGKAFFGKDFHGYQKMPRTEALEVTSRCNVTVCSSLNETFALFVAEGMAMGHPIIRNKSSGWNEQINDGINGYLFDNLDLQSLAQKLETVLDVGAISNEQLARMGQASQDIAHKFENADYYSQLIESK